MPIALTGGLIGVAVGLALFSVEYMLLRGAMAERTKRMRQKRVFDPSERKRVAALVRFVLCVPVACALLFWYFGS